MMNRLFRKYNAYLSFGLVYAMFWFLFKLGGWPDLPMALYSSLIDISITLLSLVIAVEILLPRYVYKERYLKFIGMFTLLVLVAGSVMIVSQMALMNQSILTYQENFAKQNKHFVYWFWADLIFGSYFMVFFISITGAAVRLAFEKVNDANKAKQLEAEIAVAQLELLKEQINPHFLFNALNTIYYKIEKTNADGRQTLQRFSNMLRYQLYECDKPVVEIEKELLFLESYIQLQQQRYSDCYDISFRGFDEVKGFSISPFLLLPLVENCFKHISHKEGKGNFISIRCGYKEGVFIFETSNSTDTVGDSKNKGLGLSNITKRLQLLYPNAHKIDQISQGEMYAVVLQIRLD